MFERIQKLLDRIESRVALWKIFSSGGIVSVGGISAWIASAEAWLDQYGAIAWWFAGLLGALITTVIILAFAWLRSIWVKTAATRKWQEQTPGVNPLAAEFHKARIDVQKFANPISPRITSKKFYDCELVGPATLYIHLHNTLMNTGFINCDLISLNENRKSIVQNAIALEYSEIHGCQIIGCTLLVEPQLVPVFQGMGSEFLTITEGSGDGNQSPEDTEAETQPKIPRD